MSNNKKTCVIMCCWSKIFRLPITCELIKSQTVVPDFRIWNNSFEEKSKIDEILEYYQQYLNIDVKHSEENVAGMGRFFYARELKNKYDYIITIDDDQVFDTDFVQHMISVAEPRTMKSCMARKFPEDDYWNKQKVSKRDKAKYCATCGMIVDSSLFDYNEVFEYPFSYVYTAEDLWLSYCADHIAGFKLQDTGYRNIRQMKSRFGKKVMSDNKQKKQDLFKHCIELGWDAVGAL